MARIPVVIGRDPRARGFDSAFVKARLYSAPQLHQFARRHQVHAVAAFVHEWIASRCCAASFRGKSGIPRALEVFHVRCVSHAGCRAGAASWPSRAYVYAVRLRVWVRRRLEPRVLPAGFTPVLRRPSAVIGRQRRRNTPSVRWCERLGFATRRRGCRRVGRAPSDSHLPAATQRGQHCASNRLRSSAIAGTRPAHTARHTEPHQEKPQVTLHAAVLSSKEMCGVRTRERSACETAPSSPQLTAAIAHFFASGTNMTTPHR